MGIGGREKLISLSARKPGWQNNPDLQTNVSPEKQLEQKQHLEKLFVVLNAVMKILSEHEEQALRQIFYKDRTFQRNQRTLSRGKETAQQITKRALPKMRHPEVRASIRQLLGGPKTISVPETIKINLKGNTVPVEITKEKFVDEVMELFDGKSLTPEGIAEALGCHKSWVYFVIISKLYERELKMRDGDEQVQAPNKSSDTMKR